MNQTVVALGMFDGVHLGHRALLSRAAVEAHQNGDRAVAFTFSNHPRELFSGAFSYICTPEQRETLIRDCGCDRVDSVPFDRTFASMEPDAFLDWLAARYEGRISAIVAGYDYRFGAGAKGDTALLNALCAAHGIRCIVIDKVEVAGAACASTRVRESIQKGDLPLATLLLGRPYVLSGTVVHAKALGRQYDYPTANLSEGNQILPPDGVYATELLVSGRRFDAVTNVGTNPTVGGRTRTVETHVIGKSLDLYGKRIGVAFYRRLRGERRFESREALFAQIGEDAGIAEKVLQETKKGVYNLERLC